KAGAPIENQAPDKQTPDNEKPEAPPEKSPETKDDIAEAGAQKPQIVDVKDFQGEEETPPNTVVTGEYGPVGTKDAYGNTRSFDYNSAGELDQVVDEDGTQLVRQVEENGSYKWHAYDQDGKPIMSDGKPLVYDSVSVSADGTFYTQDAEGTTR